MENKKIFKRRMNMMIQESVKDVNFMINSLDGKLESQYFNKRFKHYEKQDRKYSKTFDCFIENVNSSYEDIIQFRKKTKLRQLYLIQVGIK